MSTRLIDVSVAVYAKIEFLASQFEAFVQRRQQQVDFSPESIHRHSQKAMVTPCVASHYGSVAISAGLVGQDNLPLQ